MATGGCYLKKTRYLKGFSEFLCKDFLVAQMVKCLPTVRETRVRSLIGKTPWRRKWQPTLVLLPRKIPWVEELGGLQSMGSQRVGHDERLHFMYRKMRVRAH